jgi:hypothetical protein
MFHFVPDTPIKLKSGQNSLSGRAEVLKSDGWNNICYTGNKLLDRDNARVVCRTKGLSTGYVVRLENNNSSFIRLGRNKFMLGVHGRVKDVDFKLLSPYRCWRNFGFFMWGGLTASQRNVDGSTQVPVRAWNNARKATLGHSPPGRLESRHIKQPKKICYKK